jgi:hypothetical protein
MPSVFLGPLEVFLERQSILLKLSFNGEGGIFFFHHVSQFNIICNTLDICDENEYLQIVYPYLARKNQKLVSGITSQIHSFMETIHGYIS